MAFEIEWNKPVGLKPDTFVSDEGFDKYSLLEKPSALISGKYQQLCTTDDDRSEEVQPNANSIQKNYISKSETSQQMNREPQHRKMAIRIPFPRLSWLSMKEHDEYLCMLTKLSKIGPNHLDNRQFGHFKELQARVTKEQEEFQAYLENVAHQSLDDYNYFNPAATEFFEKLMSSEMERINQYPRFYKVLDTISLGAQRPAEHIDLIHQQRLLEMGSVPKVILPKHNNGLKSKIHTTTKFDKINKYLADGTEMNNLYEKMPDCSDDPNAWSLASKYEVDFVICSSALQCLLDNPAPGYSKQWEIPVKIQNVPCHQQDHPDSLNDKRPLQMIYIDEPFHSKTLIPRERNQMYYQFAVKCQFQHPLHPASGVLHQKCPEKTQTSQEQVGDYETVQDLGDVDIPRVSHVCSGEESNNFVMDGTLEGPANIFTDNSEFGSQEVEENPKQFEEHIDSDELNHVITSNSTAGIEQTQHLRPCESFMLKDITVQSQNFLTSTSENTISRAGDNPSEHIRESPVTSDCQQEQLGLSHSTCSGDSDEEMLFIDLPTEILSDEADKASGITALTCGDENVSLEVSHSLEGNTSVQPFPRTDSPMSPPFETLKNVSPPLTIPITRSAVATQVLSVELSPDTQTDLPVTTITQEDKAEPSENTAGVTTITNTVPKRRGRPPKKKVSGPLLVGHKRSQVTGCSPVKKMRDKSSVNKDQDISLQTVVLTRSKSITYNESDGNISSSGCPEINITEVAMSVSDGAMRDDVVRGGSSAGVPIQICGSQGRGRPKKILSMSKIPSEDQSSPVKCTNLQKSHAEGPRSSEAISGKRSPVHQHPQRTLRSSRKAKGESLQRNTGKISQLDGTDDREASDSWRDSCSQRQTEKVKTRNPGESVDCPLDQILQAQSKLLKKEPAMNAQENSQIHFRAILSPPTGQGDIQAHQHHENLSKERNSWQMAEDPTEYSIPAHGNAIYDTWKLDNLTLLVRSRYDGVTKSHKTKLNSFVHISSKLEYQPQYGFEQFTHTELTRAWLTSKLQPNCRIVMCRINAYTGDMMDLEDLDSSEIVPHRSGFNMFNPGLRLTVLQTILKRLKQLPQGGYLLSHTPGQLHLQIKQTTPSTIGVYDLYKAHDGNMHVDSLSTLDNIPWVPIDPVKMLPFHQRNNRIPGTFEPKDCKPSHTFTLTKRNKKQPKQNRKKKSF